jgi:predicted amidohydrolase
MSTIAVAQITSSTDKAANLKLARELIGEAKRQGARMIAFPEFLMAFSPLSQTAEELAEVAEPVYGPFVTSLRHAASANGIDVLATLYESCDLPNRVHDSALWIGGGGEIVAAYRKLHLYDAFGFKESDKFLAGDDLTPPVERAIGSSGMMICYDLRFPELARLLALLGAELIFSPSGWVQGDLKVDHWRTMIGARALENGCYVVAPDQVGNIYIGHSMVADPFGRTVVDLGEREGLALVEIDLALVREAREKLPLLKNRRADVYDKYTAHT